MLPSFRARMMAIMKNVKHQRFEFLLNFKDSFIFETTNLPNHSYVL